MRMNDKEDGILIKEDILIDEAAFAKAAKDFEQLGEELAALRSDIGDMLGGLKTGFNTPAGVKFMEACGSNVLQPLNDQKAVLEHIASSLRSAVSEYKPVFSEYAALQTTINNSRT